MVHNLRSLTKVTEPGRYIHHVFLAGVSVSIMHSLCFTITGGFFLFLFLFCFVLFCFVSFRFVSFRFVCLFVFCFVLLLFFVFILFLFVCLFILFCFLFSVNQTLTGKEQN